MAGDEHAAHRAHRATYDGTPARVVVFSSLSIDVIRSDGYAESRDELRHRHCDDLAILSNSGPSVPDDFAGGHVLELERRSVLVYVSADAENAPGQSGASLPELHRASRRQII